MKLDLKKLFTRSPRLHTEFGPSRPSRDQIVEERMSRRQNPSRRAAPVPTPSLSFNGAEMVPFIPDPSWIEKNGWEYVGFREPRLGEVFVTRGLTLDIRKAETSIDNALWNGKRWILKPGRQAVQPPPQEAQVASAEPTADPAMPPVPDVNI